MAINENPPPKACVDCIKTRFKPLNPALKSFCKSPEEAMTAMAETMKSRVAPQVESVPKCDHPEDFEQWIESE